MLESDHSHSSFSLRRLGSRLRSIPALLMLLPFVAGVLLGDSLSIALWVVVGLFVVAFGSLMLLRHRALRRLSLLVVMLLTGYLVVELRGDRCEVATERELELVVRLSSIPERRYSQIVGEGVVEAWREGDEWHGADCYVMLRLHDESLAEGDRVQLRSTIRGQMSRYEGYNALLHRRGFVGRVDIPKGRYVVLEDSDRPSLHALSVRRLERHLRDTAAYATAEAMVVGSKRMLDPEIGRDYAQTGLSHLMAISGLHLGIVMFVVALLLRPLLLIYRGLHLRALLVIVVLWLFAAVSGFSPSVVRSALMLSVLQLSEVSLLRYNSVNALSVVVMAMLAYNPNYLWDVSFQLSVLAVMGIVVWAVPLLSFIAHHQVRCMWLMTTLVISLVASLWAMPVIGGLYGEVNMMNIVLSPLIFVTANVVVGFGVFALVLPDVVARPFGYVMEWAAGVQNGVVELGSGWNFGTLTFEPSVWGVVLIYSLFAIITLVAWSWEEKKVITLSLDE